jgi:uncharacterized protein (TIGR03435 family)
MFRILLIACGLPGSVFAQAPAAAPARPSFEVASIKAAPPIDPRKIMSGQMHIGMSVDSARVDIGSLSLADLVRTAYKVKAYQITGPDWMAAQRFDVLAKMPEGAKKEQVPEMLQSLLADRFKLAVHHENKEHPVYALVVGKNGPKLKEAEPDAAPAADAAQPKGMTFGTPEGQVRVNPNSDGRGATVAGGPFGQMKVSAGEGGRLKMEFAKISMPNLADLLSRFADKPVLDMTELKGNYQVTLDLSMDEMRQLAQAMAAQAGVSVPPGGMGRPGAGGPGGMSPADAASTPGGSSILGAVQQLGLKLDSRKLPVDTIVVDHLEKTPTEN